MALHGAQVILSIIKALQKLFRIRLYGNCDTYDLYVEQMKFSFCGLSFAAGTTVTVMGFRRFHLNGTQFHLSGVRSFERIVLPDKVHLHF